MGVAQGFRQGLLCAAAFALALPPSMPVSAQTLTGDGDPTAANCAALGFRSVAEERWAPSPTPSYAAPTVNAAGEVTVSEIITTGTYIRGAAEDAALPVEVTTRDELVRAGSPTVNELVRSMSETGAIMGEDNRNGGSVNLRSAQSGRAKVLMNGQRLPSNSAIPPEALQQTEVLKQGGSGTNGAVAGVVQFRTQGKGVTEKGAFNPPNTERYPDAKRNAIHQVAAEPVSTFSIDVDTASYSNVRRFLKDGQRPPSAAVRVEEMVNYFDYGYAGPASRDTPFASTLAVVPSPWSSGKQLIHIGVQGFKPPKGETYCATEAPKGELGFFIISDGSPRPYRMKIRAPSFVHMGAFDHMARGYLISDIITIFGTYDIVMGECDR